MTGTASVTALLLPVPEAEGLVGPWRRQYDPSEAWGVPAHITLLYPFVPPDRLGVETLSRVRALFAALAPVDLHLTDVRRFDDAVLYLAPVPADPARDLTAAIVEAFPGYPPFEGAFDKVIPHLTVTNGAPIEAMTAAEDELRSRLPLHCRVADVWLMAGRDGSGPWRTMERFPLGG